MVMMYAMWKTGINHFSPEFQTPKIHLSDQDDDSVEIMNKHVKTGCYTDPTLGKPDGFFCQSRYLKNFLTVTNSNT